MASTLSTFYGRTGAEWLDACRVGPVDMGGHLWEAVKVTGAGVVRVTRRSGRPANIYLKYTFSL